MLIEDPCYPHQKFSQSLNNRQEHKKLQSLPHMPSQRIYQVPVFTPYAQPKSIPSSSFTPYAQPKTIPSPSSSHMSNQRLYQVQIFPVCSRCHAHKSRFIFVSYMMSTSILITFTFIVPGRSLQQDVPPVRRHPSVTTGDPTPSTRLPEGSLDEGQESQACTSLPSRTVFLPLSIELVHFDL